jgi:hypothetical protein
MSECATVKIKTGPDSFITVNQEDYKDFQFMEYIEPVVKEVKSVIPEIKIETVPESLVEVTTDQVITRKKKSQTDEV